MVSNESAVVLLSISVYLLSLALHVTKDQDPHSSTKVGVRVKGQFGLLLTFINICHVASDMYQ